MLNKYQQNPSEFLRVVRMIQAGMYAHEIQDILNANIYDFAKSLDLPYARNRRTLSAKILRHLRVETPTAPFIPNEDRPNIVVCDGCRDISNVEGLRWGKLNRGEPLTWSIDRRNQPANTLSVFSDNEIHRWFLAWASLTGNRIIQITDGGVGDCHIDFKPIDGPGKVMGFVLQPRGTDEMQAGGNLSADMSIDSSERSWPLLRTRRFGKHETGHVFGLQHDADPRSLMYGLLIGDHDLDPQTRDIAQYKMRYIDQRAA